MDVPIGQMHSSDIKHTHPGSDTKAVRKKKQSYLFFLFLLILTVSVIGILYKTTRQAYSTAPKETNAVGAVRGNPGDLWADIVLGQIDFNQATPNEKVPYKGMNPGGVLIDRTTTPNRLYVYDGANSRVLGHSYLGTCLQDASTHCTTNNDCSSNSCVLIPNKPADIVLGQPSAWGYSGCNNDGNMENYPDRKPASASTLCSMPELINSPLEAGSAVGMAVDDEGNLFLPDFHNSRILKFNKPFETDTVADDVWGQDDFAGNKCNKTDLDIALGVIPSPSASTICMGRNANYQESFVAGVDIDGQGNLWVADSSNHRVLRYPTTGNGQNAKTADLVLGQPGFTTRMAGSEMNQMKEPAVVRINRASGTVYVADKMNNRVLVFEPPFTSGMSATSLIGSQLKAPSGLEIDSNGNIWISDFGNNMLELWTAGADVPSKVLFKDTFQPNEKCGTATQNATCINPLPGQVCLENMCGVSGSIGYDTAGNIYAGASTNFQDMFRFPNPIPTPQEGRLYSADYQLLSPPNGHNLLSSKGLYSPRGVVVANNQLIVSDGNKVVFWNDVSSLSNGKPADGVITVSGFEETNPWTIGRIKADSQNRLWVIRKGTVDVYQLPLTHLAQPIRAGALTHERPVSVLGGGEISWNFHDDFLDIEPDPTGDFLWVSQGTEMPPLHRIFRVKNPFTNPVVDVILGQPDALGKGCNQQSGTDYEYMYTFKAPNTVCFPGTVKLDRLGNLWVSDHYQEVKGNLRLLMFDHSLFSNITDTPLFGPNATIVSPQLTAFEPAFDSQNRMILGYNSWGRFPAFPGLYSNPLATFASSVEPDAMLKDFFSHGYASAFDEHDNLYIADLNRGRVLVYFTPMSFINPPEPTQIPSPTPSFAASPTPTPTLKPIFLLNQSFEIDENNDGVPDDWERGASRDRHDIRTDETHYFGQYSFKFLTNPLKKKIIQQTVGSNQNPLPLLTKFFVSGMAKADNLTNNTVRVNILVYYEDNTRQSFSLKFPSAGSFDWTQRTGIIPVNKPMQSITIAAETSYLNVGSSVYFDDIRLSEQPLRDSNPEVLISETQGE